MLTRIACCAVLCLLAAPAQLRAQRLALRHYDVADGLAHSFVGAIHQDAHGYLWFGTREGLSCFDGYRFTNYGTRDGLEHPIINDIAEDRQGRLWVATNGGGVARLVNEPTNRTAGRKFVSYSLGETSGANRVNALLFDAQHRLWCATDAGLYRAVLGSDTQLKFEVVVPHKEVTIDMEARADSHGRLWFTLLDEVIEVVGEQIIKYSAPDFGSPYSFSLAADQQGRLLMGGAREVFEFVAPPAAP